MAEPNINLCDSHIISNGCAERFLPIQQAHGSTLRSLDISLAGISTLREEYRIGRVRPNWHVLLYTLKGRGKLWTEDGSTPLSRGSVVFLPRHTTHLYELDGKSWKILWFHLRPMETWKHLERLEWEVRKARYLELLEPLMEGLLREAESEDAEGLRASASYSELIALYLKRELSFTHSAAEWETREKLRRLWNEVDADLGDAWTVSRMARMAHVSPGHFHRLMQQVYGVAPLEKLTAMRMHRAETLLQSTSLPGYQIAEIVGYSNPYAFSTTFKRFFGKTPSEARRVKQSWQS